MHPYYVDQLFNNFYYYKYTSTKYHQDMPSYLPRIREEIYVILPIYIYSQTFFPLVTNFYFIWIYVFYFTYFLVFSQSRVHIGTFMRLIYFALFVSMSKSDLKYIELIYRIIKSYGFSNNNNNGKKYIAFLRIEICMYGWRLPFISTFKFFSFPIVQNR